MAIRSTFTTGEVLTAADLTDTIKGAFINTETTTARTLGTADAGNLVTLNNNSGGTVTIPTNTTWGSPLGTLVHLINIGTAGSFTVGTAAGVTLNAASATLAIQEGGTLIKTATNTWQFVKGGGLGKAQYSSTTGSPTVTTVSGKTCVQFTGSGSITISQAGLVEVLVVGGGGSGGFSNGGGGGAGGYLSLTDAYLPSGAQTVVVGAGGTTKMGNGVASRVGPLYAVGGGAGGSAAVVMNGMNGGSGGGANGASATALTGGSATSDQGKDGGSNFTSGGYGAGGGGGAGAVGANGTSAASGAGGNGVSSSINGSSVTRGGGGGGGATVDGATAGAGGSGGGAAGGANNGSVNTGGGGGGGGHAVSGGNGGSGVVILLFG